MPTEARFFDQATSGVVSIGHSDIDQAATGVAALTLRKPQHQGWEALGSDIAAVIHSSPLSA